MQIDSTRFGRIEIPDEAVIRFPRGLYGLDGARSYCLLKHDEPGRFQWLQAADAPAIAMVVTDPFLFFASYEVEIPDPAAELLRATAAADITLYTSITVSLDRQQIYTNLLGPLVINHRARLGMQVIQDTARYSTRHLIGSGVQAFGRSGVQTGEVKDTSILVEPEHLNARTPGRLST
jgi:flagellar assembly factor FliW